jgi:small subunit ribosomal protein S1
VLRSEGLVHLTELPWKKKPSHPSDYGFSVGDNVEVMILDIDQKLQRLALSIKQCVKNPWMEFIENYRVGDEVVRSIARIVDYGFFVGLEEGVDGLVHTSEISAVVKGKAKLSDYKKGDEVNVVILGINVEEERISLGIK